MLHRLALGSFLALIALLGALPVWAQGPAAEWRTLSTEHFRVHYPVESEAWARRAASRLESIWERVISEVGFRPVGRIDVLVSDPFAEPNGAAFPLLGWPRLMLWTSPPGPESVIGHYTDWGELLLVHEGAHLVHLLRPSRNPVERGLARVLPLGPVARKAPRWVIEGYATLVEGRLTASGRPHGDLRAALLRRRAALGRLPGYGGLNGDGSWLGGSLAYLVGSAFLEWLDGRAAADGVPDSLPRLWARLSARRNRSFDEAFRGVYGGSPAELYGRFTAELTHGAIEVERRLAERIGAAEDGSGGARRRVGIEGEVWQDLSWSVGPPALSPDGGRIALVRRGRDEPAELVVWSTAPDTAAEEKWQKERAEIARRDPEDVPAVRSGPLPREPLHVLPTLDGRAPSDPRFLPAGSDREALLFTRFEPDGEGFLHPDLFLWEMTSGRVTRVTRLADVREADPAPDGTWAVAVRHRHGASQLVRVNLETGAVTPLTEASVEVVVGQPRLSPDGRRVVYARHRSEEGLWALAVRDVATGEESALAPPIPGATVASPAWSRDGRTVYAVVGSGGFLDVYAFAADPVGGAAARPVTHTAGAAFAPEPTPDGAALFYLSLKADGFDLARVDLTATAEPAAIAAVPTAEIALPEAAKTTEQADADPFAGLAPVVRPTVPAAVVPFQVGQVAAGAPYGFGRLEWLPLVGGQFATSGGAAELGVRVGDLVGRLDALVLGAAGDGTLTGGALAAAWRGLPVETSFHLFAVDERPSRQDGPLPSGARSRRSDLDRRGLELRALWDRRWGPARLRLSGGLLFEDIGAPGGAGADEASGFLEAQLAASHSWGKWWWQPGVAVHWEGGGDWDRAGGLLDLGLGRDDTGLRLRWRREELSGRLPAGGLLRLGGTASSLLPRSVLAGRIVAPALPFGTLSGERYEGQRAELSLGFLPVPLFAERHRLGFGSACEWLDPRRARRALDDRPDSAGPPACPGRPAGRGAGSGRALRRGGVRGRPALVGVGGLAALRLRVAL